MALLSENDVREMLLDSCEGGPRYILARKLGVSEGYVSLLLNGKRRPSGRVLDYLNLERIVEHRYRSRRT